MNEYNERWTREKFIEYRKLKRNGYSHEMLKEHFGEDIYYSGLYNKNGTTLPLILKFGKFINEIKITPEEVDYSLIKQPSIFIKGKSDYIISFFSNSIPYIISLVYFPINNKETFNVIFTTRNQWNDYEYNLINFLKKGSLTNDEFKILEDIIDKETGLNDLFPILRKISWILLDFYNNSIKGELLSIGDTENKKKINLYRNIIKDSFDNIIETEDYVSIHKYYIYKIN
jgi:hypothetical protein